MRLHIPGDCDCGHRGSGSESSQSYSISDSEEHAVNEGCTVGPVDVTVPLIDVEGNAVMQPVNLFFCDDVLENIVSHS